MASEFTKGPWRTAFQAYRMHSSPTRFWQASITSQVGRTAVAIGTTEEEANANARLIAAAPELLEALKYMYDSARELSCECFELGAIQAAKEAIAKAEGTHE